MPTQAERRAATRSAVLDAAQSLFSEHGYGATSVSDVLARAGVSRGALYHHFAAKDDVLAAVFLQVSTDTIRAASARVKASASPRQALVDGCLAWLDAATEPATAQILLVDGPNELGWERSRTLEESTSLGVMRASVRAAVEAGELHAPSVDLTARLLNAMLAEAALGLMANPSRKTRTDTRKMITAFIDGLQP